MFGGLFTLNALIRPNIVAKSPPPRGHLVSLLGFDHGHFFESGWAKRRRNSAHPPNESVAIPLAIVVCENPHRPASWRVAYHLDGAADQAPRR